MKSKFKLYMKCVVNYHERSVIIFRLNEKYFMSRDSEVGIVITLRARPCGVWVSAGSADCCLL